MPRNYEVPEYESLLEFQEVYLQAIALAWKSEAFKKALLDDAEKALDNAFGYKNPWSVKLKVADPKDLGPDGKPYGWDSGSGSWRLPRNTIHIGMPKQPEPDDQAMALACYNNAGPSYLFTCC